MMKKRLYIGTVSSLLTMFVVSFSLLTGCERKEDSLPEVYPAEGNAYMEDPEFKAAIKHQNELRDMLNKRRIIADEKRDALLKKYGSKESVEASPEWKALKLELEAVIEDFKAHRQQTAKIVRERLLRAQADSERIARGEARSVKISNEENK